MHLLKSSHSHLHQTLNVCLLKACCISINQSWESGPLDRQMCVPIIYPWILVLLLIASCSHLIMLGIKQNDCLTPFTIFPPQQIYSAPPLQRCMCNTKSSDSNQCFIKPLRHPYIWTELFDTVLCPVGLFKIKYQNHLFHSVLISGQM